jgi:hypothetical protein
MDHGLHLCYNLLSSTRNRDIYCGDVPHLAIIRLDCLGAKLDWSDLVSKCVHTFHNNLRYIYRSGDALASSFYYHCWLVRQLN